MISTHDLDYSRFVSLTGINEPSVLSFRLDKISDDLLFFRLNKIRLEHYPQKAALISIDEKGFRFRTLPVVRN